MNPRLLTLLALGFVSLVAYAELPADLAARAHSVTLKSYALTPTRILWQSDHGVKDSATLLQDRPGQVSRPDLLPTCTLTASPDGIGGVLLDFGTELNATIEIGTNLLPGENNYQPRIRVRFGESASEAMAELDDRQAGNDYAIRDEIVMLPWAGTKVSGPSGFRFVRLDAVDPQKPVPLRHVHALLTLQDAPKLGSFKCSDEQLNKIWKVGTYTIELNMQDYVWDGIKRDRLVWIGDLQPEVAVIQSVFGAHPSVPRSLDLIRDVTPPAKWMHGISSYSLWWILIQERWWLQNGDKAYLETQRTYLKALLPRLASLVTADGAEHLDGMRYLDWPTWENKPGIAAGLHALLILSLDSGAQLMTALGDPETARTCTAAAGRARTILPDPNNSKAAAALQALAGLRDAKQVARDYLMKDGARGFSPFFGFYVLEALGHADETDTALDFIRTHWGAMIDRGATTFWEDFDLKWLENSGRVDELTPPGKRDLHGDFGIYGSAGFRKSLCHGWSAGPTAFLIEHILGVRPLEPGCTKLLVHPSLGSLKWAEGSYPTPHGIVKVRAERHPDGTIKTQIDAPTGIEVVRAEPDSKSFLP